MMEDTILDDIRHKPENAKNPLILLTKFYDIMVYSHKAKLHLRLHPKSKIYPAHRGVDFGGYRIFRTRLLPRKRNLKAARIRFRMLAYHFHRWEINLSDVRPRVASFLGYVRHCKARRSAATVLGSLVLQRGRRH